MKTRILLISLLSISSVLHGKVDFLRIMFNHNGDTRATIGWHQATGDSARVFWGTEDIPPSRYLDYSNYSNVVSSNTFKGLNNNFVRLKNLDPNTAYYFVIKDSDGISERFWFKTTPKGEDARLSLIAGGDSRSRRPTRQQGFNMVGKLRPHAVLFDGDYTDIDNEQKWLWWFEDYKLTYKDYDNRLIPFVNVRGNHESSNSDLTNFFDCPAKNNVYNVTMGGYLLNIICLNTEIAFGGKQRRFLEQTLIAHENYGWQIPLYHRACRPHVNWKMKMKGVKQIYRKWIALFEKHGVRLAIECDSHITKTTWPIRKSKEEGHEDGFVRDDENGIIYAGEGCWGAPLRTPDRIRSWTRDADKINSFKWIFVDADQIVLRTVEYMNSTAIEALTDATRFNLPDSIKIWSPSNGDVVNIKK